MHGPYERLGIKLWDTLVDKGICGWLRPLQIRREGRARIDVAREEMLLLAQAERDAKDILAGKKDLLRDDTGRLLALPLRPLPHMPEATIEPRLDTTQHEESPSNIIVDSIAKSVAREIQRNVNLHRIALSAEEQAEAIPDDEVSDAPIDSDWVSRWRDNAQDVTDEHMQKVWARILTEEVKTPGTYSLKTLEFLRTLGKADAKRIAAVGPYALNSSWVYRDEPYLEKKGIGFLQLLELQELGILSGVESAAGSGLQTTIRSTTADKLRVVIRAYGKVLLVQQDAAISHIEAPCYRITKLGQEILGLGDYQPDETYLRRLGAELKGRGHAVQLGDWVRTAPDAGRLLNMAAL